MQKLLMLTQKVKAQKVIQKTLGLTQNMDTPRMMQKVLQLKIMSMKMGTIRTIMAVTITSTKHMISMLGATTFMDMGQGMGMGLITLHMMNMLKIWTCFND